MTAISFRLDPNFGAEYITLHVSWPAYHSVMRLNTDMLSAEFSGREEGELKRKLNKLRLCASENLKLPIADVTLPRHDIITKLRRLMDHGVFMGLVREK